MFYHSKELNYKARVSHPDARLATLMLEQFGGGNGELSASMQYFVQAFACHNPYPDKYDMLMDIAAEELGHLEIVGATIQMLLAGVNGNMKDAVEKNDVFGSKISHDDFIHSAFAINPQFGVVSAGGPMLVSSTGIPWQAAYINANGDLTVDLRSNMASESRAKIVYEYLMQFTDDPYVLDTLNYLMTREVTHYQQFEAALETIRPNFPPGILQSDPRYSNLYQNNSCGCAGVGHGNKTRKGAKGSKVGRGENGPDFDCRGPWNEGTSTQLGEEWQYISNPREHVIATDGLTEQQIEGSGRTLDSVRNADRKLAVERSGEIRRSVPDGEQQWCDYDPAPVAEYATK